MNARSKDKEKAMELRKKGFTYKEIRQHIKVSKSLLSEWFKSLVLTPGEEEFLNSRMVDRQNKGRIGAMLSNRNRRITREITAFEDARITFEKNKHDWVFLTGITLYWAEGSKRTGCFQFINSDPEMVVCMFKWIKKYMNVDKKQIRYRLFIHKIPGYENAEGFWAQTLGIEPYYFEKTIYKPTTHAIKKNPNYKGCLRLEVGGIYELRVLRAWQKLLIQYYGKVMK